jgi:hypothetical protein
MQNAAFVQEVVNLTNQYRTQRGLSALYIDLDLAEAAQSYAQNMAVNDFFSHYGLDGSRPWDRAQAAGYESGIVGENIGVGYRTPAEIFDGWINSESHRAAILNPRYNEIGVGYYFLENDTGDTNYNSYWTQLFGEGEIEAFAQGALEQRPVVLPESFDSLQYGASHPDLILAFGYNPDAFTQHYLDSGASEGRALDVFDEFRYLASYDDLLNAFRSNVEAATQHYIQSGYGEGRSAVLFKPLQYLASHDDLINALGQNSAAATQHFVQFGFLEQRSRDSFKEAIYLASNSDLIIAFGYALEAATEHYIQFGMREGRPKETFDPVAYLNQYADLQAAFGNDQAAATQHFIEFGFFEGR